MSVRNLPIFQKILLILGGFAALVVIAAAFSTTEMRSIAAGYSAASAHDESAALGLSRARSMVNLAWASVGGMVVSTDAADDETYSARFDRARTEAVKALAAAAAASTEGPESAAALGQRTQQVLDHDCADTIAAGRSSDAGGTALAAKLYQKDCGPRLMALSDDLTAQLDRARARVVAEQAALAARSTRTVLITWGVILAGLVLLCLAAFAAIRAWIVNPLRQLNAVMQLLAQGKDQAEIPGANRGDEVGAMARTVTVFRDAAREKARIEAAGEQERQAAAAERQAREAAQAQESAAQAAVVEAIGGGLTNLASGDLTHRITASFPVHYERLRTDFNAAVAKLQELLRGVVANTEALRSGTSEIAQATDDLSRRTEQQAASLEQTAAALDEITATVKRTAEGATQAREAVARTRADTEQSGAVVREAVAAMGEIEASSQQIGRIIGVIDEIAFQTNLLALNAGVEAARAGDAGRGFAVVASEVRALAQRSAEAAKEIKSLISASAQQVETGVKLVGRTGDALNRIATLIAEVDAVVNNIAASAQEQASGLVEVNTAVNQMDQVTQQNAAMVEQSTAAAHSLSRETAQLASLTTRFQVGEMPHALNPPPPAKLPAAGSRAPAKASPRKPHLKHAQVVPAARAAAHAHQDWQEF